MNEPEAPLSRHLEDPASEALLQAGWQGLEARRRTKPRDRRPAFVMAGAGALALAVAVFVGWPSKTPPPRALTLADGNTLAPSLGGPGPERWVLSDDSRLELGPGTKLELGENRPGQLHLLLRQGRMALDVRSQGRTRWRIDSGSTSIEVVGTRFVVERQGDRTQVTVTEGKVRVSDPHLVPPVQYLGPGEVLSPPEARSAQTTLEPQASRPPTASEMNRRRSRTPAAASTPTPPGPTGPPESPPPTDPPPNPAITTPAQAEDLLREADEARRRGDHPRAAAVLARVAEGSDTRAALAALTLGRLLLDELEDPAGADRALVRALALPLPSGMNEFAWARRVEAKARQGARAEAQALADEYQRRFPSGRFWAEVQAWSVR
jgi:transmembrane sensor